MRRLLRTRDYDYGRLFELLATLTNSSVDRVASYYDELRGTNGPLAVLAARIEVTPGMDHALDRIRRIGLEKYARLDRTALYCLVRAKQPNVFVETGTRWGMGSFFIASALSKNGHGHLYSFDIGVEGSRRDYEWPVGQDRLGFLIPEPLEAHVTIVEGDSIATLPRALADLPEVDVFYHDSLHTYEHMMGEFEIVYPYMAPGGIFMSEDTDLNDAWDDFMADKRVAASATYCSHLGIATEREVQAVRLP